MKDVLFGAAILSAAIWWIAAIITDSPDAYPRALFAVCILAGALHPDINPVITAAAGALAHRDLNRAWIHHRYGRYHLS